MSMSILTENDVVNAVASFLKRQGYKINQALTTTQRGIDIKATKKSDGTRCFVEAKGATSSIHSSNRYGKEFNNNQIKTHIGVALLKSFQTLQSNPKSEVVIALPDNEGHRKVIESMSTPIKKSGINVYLVSNTKKVKKYI